MDVEDGIVKNQFVGGCNGNTKGIAALVEGMPSMRGGQVWRASMRKPSYLMSGISWQRHLKAAEEQGTLFLRAIRKSGDKV